MQISTKVKFINMTIQQLLVYKENISSVAVRFHHRICDTQKHLLQVIVKLMEEIHSQDTSLELVLEVITNLQMLKKIYFIGMRILQGVVDSENITSIDVRFHHRICDAQKHLVYGNGKLMEEINSQEKNP